MNNVLANLRNAIAVATGQSAQEVQDNAEAQAAQARLPLMRSERIIQNAAELRKAAKSHVEIFNERCFGMSVNKGHVNLEKPKAEGPLEAIDNDTDMIHLTDLEENQLGIIDAYLDEHPEGAGRGGYVTWVEFNDGSKIYYMDNDGEWSC